MGIMDMFRTTPAATTGTPATPATPGNIPPKTESPTATTPGTASNGVVPSGAAEPPVVDFKTLWENEPIDPKAPPAGLFPNIDPAKLLEAASKIDFAKVIKPETLAAITAGGEGAQAAFTSALNQISQTVYAQNSFATTKIVEQAVTKVKDEFLKSIPDLVKAQTLRESTLTENPALSNPAYSPLVQAVQQQLQQKYPTATAKDLRELTSKYFDNLSDVMKPPSVESPAAKKARESEDWSSFLP